MEDCSRSLPCVRGFCTSKCSRRLNGGLSSRICGSAASVALVFCDIEKVDRTIVIINSSNNWETHLTTMRW